MPANTQLNQTVINEINITHSQESLGLIVQLPKLLTKRLAEYITSDPVDGGMYVINQAAAFFLKHLKRGMIYKVDDEPIAITPNIYAIDAPLVPRRIFNLWSNFEQYNYLTKRSYISTINIDEVEDYSQLADHWFLNEASPIDVILTHPYLGGATLYDDSRVAALFDDSAVIAYSAIVKLNNLSSNVVVDILVNNDVTKDTDGNTILGWDFDERYQYEMAREAGTAFDYKELEAARGISIPNVYLVGNATVTSLHDLATNMNYLNAITTINGNVAWLRFMGYDYTHLRFNLGSGDGKLILTYRDPSQKLVSRDDNIYQLANLLYPSDYRDVNLRPETTYPAHIDVSNDVVIAYTDEDIILEQIPSDQIGGELQRGQWYLTHIDENYEYDDNPVPFCTYDYLNKLIIDRLTLTPDFTQAIDFFKGFGLTDAQFSIVDGYKGAKHLLVDIGVSTLKYFEQLQYSNFDSASLPGMYGNVRVVYNKIEGFIHPQGLTTQLNYLGALSDDYDLLGYSFVDQSRPVGDGPNYPTALLESLSNFAKETYSVQPTEGLVDFNDPYSLGLFADGLEPIDVTDGSVPLSSLIFVEGRAEVVLEAQPYHSLLPPVGWRQQRYCIASFNTFINTNVEYDDWSTLPLAKQMVITAGDDKRSFVTYDAICNVARAANGVLNQVIPFDQALFVTSAHAFKDSDATVHYRGLTLEEISGVLYPHEDSAISYAGIKAYTKFMQNGKLVDKDNMPIFDMAVHQYTKPNGTGTPLNPLLIALDLTGYPKAEVLLSFSLTDSRKLQLTQHQVVHSGGATPLVPVDSAFGKLNYDTTKTKVPVLLSNTPASNVVDTLPATNVIVGPNQLLTSGKLNFFDKALQRVFFEHYEAVDLRTTDVINTVIVDKSNYQKLLKIGMSSMGSNLICANNGLIAIEILNYEDLLDYYNDESGGISGEEIYLNNDYVNMEKVVEILDAYFVQHPNNHALISIEAPGIAISSNCYVEYVRGEAGYASDLFDVKSDVYSAAIVKIAELTGVAPSNIHTQAELTSVAENVAFDENMGQYPYSGVTRNIVLPLGYLRGGVGLKHYPYGIVVDEVLLDQIKTWEYSTVNLGPEFNDAVLVVAGALGMASDIAIYKLDDVIPVHALGITRNGKQLYLLVGDTVQNHVSDAGTNTNSIGIGAIFPEGFVSDFNNVGLQGDAITTLSAGISNLIRVPTAPPLPTTAMDLYLPPNQDGSVTFISNSEFKIAKNDMNELFEPTRNGWEWSVTVPVAGESQTDLYLIGEGSLLNLIVDTTLTCSVQQWYGDGIASIKFRCPNLNGVSEAVVPGLTTCFEMFKGCSALTIGNSFLANQMLGTVTSCESMFEGCTSLNIRLGDVALTGVTNTVNMFKGCTSFTNQKWSDYDAMVVTALNATNCEGMFEGCINLPQTVRVATPAATNTNRMFYGCSSIIDVSFSASGYSFNAVNAEYMFYGCSKLSSVGGLAANSNLRFIEHMFDGCSIYYGDELPSNLTLEGSMDYAFANSKIDSYKLRSYNTALVTSMVGLFFNNTSMSQELYAWNVELITEEPANFAPNLDVACYPVWGSVGNVYYEVMRIMVDGGTGPGTALVGIDASFGNASPYPVGKMMVDGETTTFGTTDNPTSYLEIPVNGVDKEVIILYPRALMLKLTLSGDYLKAVTSWGDENIHRVKSYSFSGGKFTSVPDHLPTGVIECTDMFSYCTLFNDPNVINWDMSNVINTSDMFKSATNFNQPLGSWKVANVKYFNQMFEYTNYDQDLSQWCTTGIDMDNLFLATGFFAPNMSEANLPVWGTCPRGY